MPAKPVDFDTIARILRASAYKKEIARDAGSLSSWELLRHRFPGLDFKPSEFSFVDQRTSNTVSIGKLLTRPFFKPSDEGSDDFKDVQRMVSFLLNKKRLIETLTSDEYIRNKVDRVNEAIARMEEHRKGRHDKFCDASDSIVGKYPIGDDDFLVFSNDPVDIFTKSTGRAWESESCERVGGQFDDGIYSDIEWCNLVVFLFEEGDAEPVGRVMLRTCEDDKHAVSFGLEPVWYTVDGRIEGDDSFSGYTKEELDERIKEIVEEKGFSLEYSTCKTPYTYQGYSDNERRGKTRITYGGEAIDAETVLHEGTVDLNADCPFCGTTIEWEVTWSESNPRRGTEARLEKAFSEVNEEIVDGFYVHDIYLNEYDRGSFNISANDIVEECPGPGCGAHRFEFEFTPKERALYARSYPRFFKAKADRWGNVREPTFDDLPEEIQKIIVSEDPDVQDFVLGEIEGEAYTILVKTIRSRRLSHDIVKFLFDYEERAVARLGRSAGSKVKRWQPKMTKAYGKAAIQITPRWNGGDLVDDDYLENKYAVTIKMDETDMDEFVKAYVLKVFGEERADELLARRVPKNVEKFKRLEKFCK